MKEENLRYHKRGVSFSKKEVHQAISNIDKGIFPGAFCKIVEDYLGGDETYCNIMHADGAGTKSSLAYLYYKETNDIDIFAGLAQDSIVMNIDDLLCVGSYDNILLSSTIGRNAALISGDIIKRIIDANDEVIQMYNDNGIRVINTGGETADVGDLVRTIIVDTTASSRMKKDKVIDANNIKKGQVIIGLASFGQASYETSYNSGIGSNGLTSARHDIFSKEYMKYNESFAPEISQDYVYTGKYSLTSKVDDMPINMGQAVLSPTRTYAPVIKAVVQEYFESIGGIIHCSGGGQTKCIKFGNKVHYIKDNLFDIPPLFKYIKECSNASWQEMYAVFNMGHRMEIIADEDVADKIIAISNNFAIDAKVVGYIKDSSSSNRVEIKSPEGLIEY